MKLTRIKSGVRGMGHSIVGNEYNIHLGDNTFSTDEINNKPLWNGKEIGGSGDLMAEVTYSELMSLKTSEELIPGMLYRIKDYKTVHIIPNTIATVNIGTTEVLIVLATSESTIDIRAYSEDFPTDIIHYNPEIPTNDACFTSALSGDWKGYITYRKDTVFNNETAYDFRNVKFRRWDFTLGLATTTNFGDLDIDGNYRYQIEWGVTRTVSLGWSLSNVVNIEHHYSANGVDPWNWGYLVTADSYTAAPGNTYTDYLTFDVANARNVSIAAFPLQDSYTDAASRLSNIVLKGAYTTNVKLGALCYNLTFNGAMDIEMQNMSNSLFGWMEEVKQHKGFTNSNSDWNFAPLGLYTCVLNTVFYKNFIIGNMQQNVFDVPSMYTFAFNSIIGGFSNNIINGSVNTITVLEGFSSNKIGLSSVANSIFVNFQRNTIETDFNWTPIDFTTLTNPTNIPWSQGWGSGVTWYATNWLKYVDTDTGYENLTTVNELT